VSTPGFAITSPFRGSLRGSLSIRYYGITVLRLTQGGFAGTIVNMMSLELDITDANELLALRARQNRARQTRDGVYPVPPDPAITERERGWCLSSSRPHSTFHFDCVCRASLVCHSRMVSCPECGMQWDLSEFGK